MWRLKWSQCNIQNSIWRKGLVKSCRCSLREHLCVRFLQVHVKLVKLSLHCLLRLLHSLWQWECTCELLGEWHERWRWLGKEMLSTVWWSQCATAERVSWRRKFNSTPRMVKKSGAHRAGLELIFSRIYRWGLKFIKANSHFLNEVWVYPVSVA